MCVQVVLFILLVTWLFSRHINKEELNSIIIIIIFIIITTARTALDIIMTDCRQYRFVNNKKTHSNFITKLAFLINVSVQTKEHKQFQSYTHETSPQHNEQSRQASNITITS